VLRAAADHKGTAFVEIYQNCPIFNDDAFAPLTTPGSREQRLIRLEHGAPIRFGAEGSKGLRFGRQGGLEAVDVAATDPDSLLAHDAHAADSSYAFALSRLDGSEFAHTPIGVFRQVPRDSYDELMAAQLADARARQGDGDLAALLAGPDTWQVS
jgi:2-oxoglutarate/2-oxoacid ferredoxin oxidoreductase subunit beta